MTHLLREKHVEASLTMSVDFANRLDSGESLSSGAAVEIKSASSGVVGDLTLAGAAISGTTVTFTASSGLATENSAEGRWEVTYCIGVTVVTSDGETEVEVVELVTYDCVQVSS